MLHPRTIDLTGRRFGKLLVLSFAEYRRVGPRGTAAYWNCKCDCGRVSPVMASQMIFGKRKSCSCGLAPNQKHGLSRTPEYGSVKTHWKFCNDPRNRGYKNYGGRGIKFGFQDRGSATRWIIENLGKRPDPSLSVDRINNDGPFGPGNLRWATRSDQIRNRRKMRAIENFNLLELKNEMERQVRAQGGDIRFQLVTPAKGYKE